MEDVILLDNVSQVVMVKQKDCAYKIFIAKINQHAQSSGSGDSYNNSRRKISGINGDRVIDKKQMSSILSLSDVTYGDRETMDEIIDDAFCLSFSKGFSRCGLTEDRTRAVNGYFSSRSSESKWEEAIVKEGISKTNTIYRTTLVEEKLTFLSLWYRKRVKAASKASKVLRARPVNDFRAKTCASLARDNSVTTEDVTLSKNTFVPGDGGLK